MKIQGYLKIYLHAFKKMARKVPEQKENVSDNFNLFKKNFKIQYFTASSIPTAQVSKNIFNKTITVTILIGAENRFIVDFH